MSGLVLSLFPGIGLLDRAFEEAGFCVVRGPDLLWGGDVRSFNVPAGRFDGVIGGPPCKAFSTLANINRARGRKLADNLIPEFERLVEAASPAWFLMENVERAPLPVVPGFQVKTVLLNNRWCGGEQNRRRRFCFGTPSGLVLHPQLSALEPYGWEPAVTTSSGGLSHFNRGGYRSFARECELQGLPGDFLKNSPLTVAGKKTLVGNGVPLYMGRVIADAVKSAIVETGIRPGAKFHSGEDAKFSPPAEASPGAKITPGEPAILQER